MYTGRVFRKFASIMEASGAFLYTRNKHINTSSKRLIQEVLKTGQILKKACDDLNKKNVHQTLGNAVRS
jgi:hypothetical protein